MLQIGYVIATGICTVGPKDRAVNITSYAVLTIYVYGFQHIILIFFKNYSNVHAVLCGRKMYLSSEVKSVDLVGFKIGSSEKIFNIRESSLNIGEKNDCEWNISILNVHFNKQYK